VKCFFVGWFGPIGVGALHFAAVAILELDKRSLAPSTAFLVFPVVSFLVLSSIVLHGITVPLFHISRRIQTRTMSRHPSMDQVVIGPPIINIAINPATSFSIEIEKEDSVQGNSTPQLELLNLTRTETMVSFVDVPERRATTNSQL